MKTAIAIIAGLLIGLVVYLSLNSSPEGGPTREFPDDISKESSNENSEESSKGEKANKALPEKDLKPTPTKTDKSSFNSDGQKNERPDRREEDFKSRYDEQEEYIADELSRSEEQGVDGNTAPRLDEFDVQIDQIEDQYDSQVESLREKIVLEENEDNRRAMEEELIQIQRAREADLSRLLGPDLYMKYMDEMIQDSNQGEQVDGHPEDFRPDEGLPNNGPTQEIDPEAYEGSDYPQGQYDDY